MLKSVADKMLPCGTPFCCWYESERVLPSRTERCLPVKDLEINFGIDLVDDFGIVISALKCSTE